jgi:hypothetical protein
MDGAAWAARAVRLAELAELPPLPPPEPAAAAVAAHAHAGYIDEQQARRSERAMRPEKLAVRLEVAARRRDRFLYLAGQRLSAEAAQSLAAQLPRAAPRVRELFLGGSLYDLGRRGWGPVVSLVGGPHPLGRLYLGSNDLGDTGAQALAQALAGNTTLQLLELAENGLTNVGAAALAPLLDPHAASGCAAALSGLHLRGNMIGDVGAHGLLAAATRGSVLTWLDLSACPISDKSVWRTRGELLERNTARTQRFPARQRLAWAGAVHARLAGGGSGGAAAYRLLSVDLLEMVGELVGANLRLRSEWARGPLNAASVALTRDSACHSRGGSGGRGAGAGGQPTALGLLPWAGAAELLAADVTKRQLLLLLQAAAPASFVEQHRQQLKGRPKVLLKKTSLATLQELYLRLLQYEPAPPEAAADDATAESVGVAEPASINNAAAAGAELPEYGSSGADGGGGGMALSAAGGGLLSLEEVLALAHGDAADGVAVVLHTSRSNSDGGANNAEQEASAVVVRGHLRRSQGRRYGKVLDEETGEVIWFAFSDIPEGKVTVQRR